MRRAEEKIKAFVNGWKIRKVLQTKEVFAMGQYIHDLIKVQDYFVYTEKSDNQQLMEQLIKDRKIAMNGYSETIQHMAATGSWVKSYIGNKIVERQCSLDTTIDECLDSPYKPTLEATGELKELITTERFLTEDDIKRSPYLFESDDFVRQKWLEKKH